jgi:hypothetical protein
VTALRIPGPDDLVVSAQLFSRANEEIVMADLGSQLNQLSPEQRQAIMMKAQQEANQQVMQEMMKHMTAACFDKCAGTSVRVVLNRGLFFVFNAWDSNSLLLCVHVWVG